MRMFTPATLNSFALAVFRALYAAAPGENLVISPLSVRSILSLAASGALEGSATRNEMLAVLGGTGPSSARPGLLSNSSVWARGKVKGEYAVYARVVYNAVAVTLSSGDPAPINQWAKDSTEGKVDALLGALDVNTTMALANTALFNATWVRRFDPASTAPSRFSPFGAEQLMCVMMQRDDRDARYVETPHAQVVQLPYSAGFSATMLLPNGEGPEALGALVESLSVDMWRDLQEDLKSSQRGVALSLPRFGITSSVDLVGPLKSMGMLAPFEGERGGAFRRITDDFEARIGVVAHGARLEVDERGAVSGGGGVMAAWLRQPPARPTRMTLDRPFLLLASDGEGAIALAAAVAAPSML